MNRPTHGLAASRDWLDKAAKIITAKRTGTPTTI
jgi:hypothetical protein